MARRQHSQPPETLHALPARAGAAAAATLAAGASPALAQSGNTFSIIGADLNTGGGLASSQSNVVIACVGDDIAGSASSENFQAEIGCAAYSLAQAYAVTESHGPGGAPTAIPALSNVSAALLAALLMAAVMMRLRRPRRRSSAQGRP